MKLQEARDILGLGANEDPRPLMDGLRMERENLAALVRGAPNETLAMRHQADLVRFDQALAAVRETLEVLGLHEPVSVDESVEELAGNAMPIEEAAEEEGSGSSFFRYAAISLIFCVAASGAGFWAGRLLG